MHKRLLFSKNVTIPMIIEKVSELTDVSVTDLKTPDKKGVRRVRAIVNTRQISMALSKVHTNMSLAHIGMLHGERDHATVLHACRTVSNLIDTKDLFTTNIYFAANKYIEEVKSKSIDEMHTKWVCFLRNDLIKTFIKAGVDLDTRMRILSKINFAVYDRYTMAPLSGKL